MKLVIQKAGNCTAVASAIEVRRHAGDVCRTEWLADLAALTGYGPVTPAPSRAGLPPGVDGQVAADLEALEHDLLDVWLSEHASRGRVA